MLPSFLMCMKAVLKIAFMSRTYKSQLDAALEKILPFYLLVKNISVMCFCCSMWRHNTNLSTRSPAQQVLNKCSIQKLLGSPKLEFFISHPTSIFRF